MNLRPRLSRLGVLSAAFAAAAVSMTATSPAQAGTIVYNVSNNCAVHPSVCDGNEMDAGLLLFYHSLASGQTVPSGSWAILYGNVSNYDHETIVSEGTNYQYHYVFAHGDGASTPVKNNAAAAGPCNPNVRDSYTVYYNSGYLGHSQRIAAQYYCEQAVRNLDSTLKNNNASQHFS